MAMMVFIRTVWFLIGVFVMLQYIYWAVMEIRYGIGWSTAPIVTHDWLFLAFIGAAISCYDRLVVELKKIVGSP